MAGTVMVNSAWNFSVTLWPFWLLLMTPTAWLWYLRLRRKPGHCRCGYDLSGLGAGQCPECGRTLPSRPPGAADSVR